MKKRKFKKGAENISIIYEDDYIFAVNKPARIASVPDKNTPLEQTALGVIQQQFAAGGQYLLHRLDYQTSGALLFGKRKTDRRALEGIFAHAETRKKYLALVKGSPHPGAIDIPLPARSAKEKIPSRTMFKVLRNFKPPGLACSLIETEIKTGRKHQLRLHFARIRYPLVMDGKYGDERFNRRFRITFRLGRLFLHAACFEFFHPLLEKRVKIEAPLPPDLKVVLKRLEAC